MFQNILGKNMKKVLFISLIILFSICGCKKHKITSLQDLEKMEIGVQTGTTSETLIQEKLKMPIIKEYKTSFEAIKNLKEDKINAVIIDEQPAVEIVKNDPSLRIIKDDFLKEKYAFAVKKGNTKLLDSIDEVIRETKKNGTYHDFIEYFINKDKRYTPNINEIDSKIFSFIKVGTNAAFPPFEYIEDGKIVGFDISFSHLIANKQDKTLIVVDKPFESLIPALLADEIDFIAAGLSITEDRKQVVDFSEPYYESEQVIIVKN